MMIDQDVVAVSPATVYRVLKKAGRLDRWNRSPSRKGTGFVQPLQAHEHWHVDISYINVAGTFFYLCSILDGYSRVIVHWDLRPSMTERDVECIVQRAREKFPDARPRIISDNGPQFIARDFKEFIRVTGMTHVRTSRNYPQSNGKLERWHKTLKSDAIRVKALADSDEARRVIAAFVGTPTACAFTARSDTWRRSTTWRVARTTSGRPAIPSSKRLESSDDSVAPSGPHDGRLFDSSSHGARVRSPRRRRPLPIVRGPAGRSPAAKVQGALAAARSHAQPALRRAWRGRREGPWTAARTSASSAVSMGRGPYQPAIPSRRATDFSLETPQSEVAFTGNQDTTSRTVH